MNEQPKFQPTPDQIIEGKFGREPIQEAEDISKTIFNQIKLGLVGIGMGEGSSQQQKEIAELYMSDWREFSNNLFQRVSAENTKNPEIVNTALKGANSLMSLRPDSPEAAKKIIDDLKRKYNIE